MIIYNITTKVAHPVSAQWQQWTQERYMPALLQTGLFQSCTLHRLLEQDNDEEGETFVLQCRAGNRADYDLFLERHAAPLRQQGHDRFGNQFISFHTAMEELL